MTQPDLTAAIAAVEQALAKEPEPADQAALRQAISVLQRVQATNQRESGMGAAMRPTPIAQAAAGGGMGSGMGMG